MFHCPEQMDQIQKKYAILTKFARMYDEGNPEIKVLLSNFPGIHNDCYCKHSEYSERADIDL